MNSTKQLEIAPITTATATMQAIIMVPIVFCIMAMIPTNLHPMIGGLVEC